MENKNKEVHILQHGYKEGVNVEIPGMLLFSVMKIIGTLADKEVSFGYEINPNSLAETALPDNYKQVISNEGVMYFSVLGELEQVHQSNIAKGVTTPIKELQEEFEKKLSAELEEMKAANPKKKKSKLNVVK